MPPELPQGTVALAQPAGPSLYEIKPEKYSERLVVIDPLRGEPASHKYKLFDEGAEVKSGITAGNGQSDRHIADEQRRLTALVGSSGEWSVEYAHGGPEGDAA